MKETLYSTLSDTAYTVPEDPGPVPLFGANITQAQRQFYRDEHLEKQKVYHDHMNMDAALKAQVIEAVEDIYLCEKRNKFTGYLGVTTKYLLGHLMERYGVITTDDLELNKRNMDEAFDSTIPIEAYFKNIDDAVKYADDAGTPFSKQQILQTAYHAISASGLYKEACKQWRKQDENTKNWDSFKKKLWRNITT